MSKLYATVFDTETSGFKRNGLCQLAGIMVDEDINPVNSFNFLVIPEGFDEIEERAAEITGHSMERCTEQGIPLRLALSILKHSVQASDLTICHNYGYDSKVIAGCCDTLGVENFLSRAPNFCTMLACVPICNIPGQYGKAKWPKLMEAYRHFFGKSFDSAHDAMADVKATVEILRVLKMNYPEALPRL